VVNEAGSLQELVRVYGRVIMCVRSRTWPACAEWHESDY
jgi:hypothetical protein